MTDDDPDRRELTVQIEAARQAAVNAPDAESLHDLGRLLLESYHRYGGTALVAEALGILQQAVEVNTTSTLLQTENGNQVTSYSQQYIESTPVNGGDITNVAFSTPGLRLNVGGGNANFNVNGLPFSSVLFTYNGADIIEPYNNNNKSGSSK